MFHHHAAINSVLVVVSMENIEEEVNGTEKKTIKLEIIRLEKIGQLFALPQVEHRRKEKKRVS